MNNTPRFSGTQLAKVGGYDDTPVLPLNPVPEMAAEDAAGGVQDYLRFVHGALRGRYILVILLSIALGVGAGVVAWQHVAWPYKSEGIVSIAFAKPVLITPTETTQMPMYQDQLLSEKTVIMSRGVADLATQDPIWKKNGVQPPHNAQGYYSSHLDVMIRSPRIVLSVTDDDPYMAAAATTAIINAYAQTYEASEKDLELKTTDLLDKQLAVLRTTIAEQTGKIREKSVRFGTTDITPFYKSDVDRYLRLKQSKDDVTDAMADAPAAAAATATTGPAHAKVITMEEKTPEQIAMTDPKMRSLVDDEQTQEDGLSQLSGLGDQNPGVIRQKNLLAAAQARVQRYLDDYQDFHKATGQSLTDPRTPVVTAGLSREELQKRADMLQKQLDGADDEMKTIGILGEDLVQMNGDLRRMRDEELVVQQRIEHLQEEAGLGGRLTITALGAVPMAPFGPDRRPKWAAMAGVAGACLPFGLAILLAMTKRRYRYADEATMGSELGKIPLLGLLPDVGSKRNNLELMQATAHGVHHLRVLLCSKTQRQAKQTYLVTSATEGEGKTNLTVALGMSFAASKQRTLVIDGDFVGRRLTEGFKAQQREGLFDALQDGSLKNRVLQVDGMMFLLPAGKVAGNNACEMTPEAIRSLLDQSCREFDTVLIDSGPILGSLEATVLAQEADGVILTIARGQHPGMLENAMRRLNMIGATLAGVVFNRAKMRDFHNSAYASTASSTPAEEAIVSEPSERKQSFSGFGPLVEAVVRTTPAAA